MPVVTRIVPVFRPACALFMGSRPACQTLRMPRFLTLADVTEVLNISMTQAYALVKSGDLPAMKVGGQGKAGQWRVDSDHLEAYIERMYAETRASIEAGSAATQHEER